MGVGVDQVGAEEELVVAGDAGRRRDRAGRRADRRHLEAAEALAGFPGGVRRRETGRGGEAARQAERDDDAPCERCAAQSSLTTSTSRHGASPC